MKKRTPPRRGADRPALHDLRGLSLTQPWATLVALREKRIETRHPRFARRYRGPVLIHAAQGFPRECQALCSEWPFEDVLDEHGFDELPLGCVVASAAIVDAWRFGANDELGPRHSERLNRVGARYEYAFGDYRVGRIGLVVGDVRPLANPIPWKGALGLWRVPDELRRMVEEQTR